MKLKLEKPTELVKGIEIISELVNEVRIKVNEFGLNITAMDPANVSLIGYSLPKEAFSVFEAEAETLGVNLDEFISDEKIESLISRTINRGAQIVANLSTGSAFFAPSAAIAAIVKTIVKDEKRTVGLCCYLNGQYGINDSCIGVPCRLGKNGIEQIVELDLSGAELSALNKSAAAVAKATAQLFA